MTRQLLDGAERRSTAALIYLMGTVYYDSVAKLLKRKRHGISAVRRQGFPAARASSRGTNEEIIQNAKGSMAKGASRAFDILA